MPYRVVDGYTPDIEKKDYIVFLKTNFQSPILNARGKVVRWVMDDDNYLYGIFPNRKTRGMMSESYMKPSGDVKTWKDKLPMVETMELDALSEDLPASWEEFSDLLDKLVADHTVDEGVIVIKDAATWQKLRAARKRVLRKELEEVVESSIEEPIDAPICDPYPLVGIS